MEGGALWEREIALASRGLEPQNASVVFDEG
jgi:hypothetical protein